MELWVASLLLVLAATGIFASSRLLRGRKALRAVCMTVCILLTLALAAYVLLTLLLVGAVSSQPPTP